MQEQAKKLAYKVVFISDLHLGSNKTAASYLFEFLNSLDCDVLEELWLVGDVIGGWEHQNAKQQPLPEMERRVIDALNYIVSRGISVKFMPGNHDEKLRPLLEALKNRKSKTLFPDNVFFTNEGEFNLKAPYPMRLKVNHGDQYDPKLFKKSYFTPVVYSVSAIYDGIVWANRRLDRVTVKTMGIHTNIDRAIKTSFKKSMVKVFPRKGPTRGIEETEFDGELFGHIHIPGIQIHEKNGRKVFLINSGDWVENASAIVMHDRAAPPEVIDYKAERKKLGHVMPPASTDAYPAHLAAMRPITDRQVRLLHRLWPARNRSRQFESLQRSIRNLERNKAFKEILEGMDARLSRNALEDDDRRNLSEILKHHRFFANPRKRQNLKALFKRAAEGRELSNRQQAFLKRALDKMQKDVAKKIAKREAAILKRKAKLDFIHVAALRKNGGDVRGKPRFWRRRAIPRPMP